MKNFTDTDDSTAVSQPVQNCTEINEQSSVAELLYGALTILKDRASNLKDCPPESTLRANFEPAQSALKVH